jgi:O-antigen/teichoic acid export membrane protein
LSRANAGIAIPIAAVHLDRSMRPLVSRTGILSHSFIVLVANVLSAGLSLLYVSFVSRNLGPAEYGNVTAAISLANISLLVLGPLSGTLIKFSARYHRDGDRTRLAGLAFDSLKQLALPLMFGVGLVAATTPILQHILHIDSPAVLLAFALFAAVSVLATVPRSVLSGEQRFPAFGANQVAEAAIRLVAGVAAVAIGLQAAGAMTAYAVGITAALVIGLCQLRHLLHVKREPLDIRALFAFSVPVLFLYSYYAFVTNIDVLVVKSQLTDTDAGLYGAASGLARLLFIAATPIYLVMFAHVSALDSKQDSRRLAMQVLAILASGLIASLVVPWLLGEWILLLLFGEAYGGAVPLLRVMWITSSLLILQVAAGHYLLAAERLSKAWMFALPCALMAALMWRFHGSTIEVALCSLAGVSAGLILTGVLFWRTPSNQLEQATIETELEAASNVSEVV